MPLFITFEGGEGSGKSEQAMALYRRLFKMNVPAVLTHEPGVTQLGRKISFWLKWKQNLEINPTTELLLFNASRSQILSEFIRPALEEGKVVICDRYFDSTTAYQGYGRRLDIKNVQAANLLGSGGVTPDVTILLDVPSEAGFNRKNGEKADRIEKEDIEFHKRVRAGYLKMAAADPKRWVVIDSTMTKGNVERAVWKKISHLFESNNK
ncbi:dTMP kinase [Chloroflexota bacterium]